VGTSWDLWAQRWATQSEDLKSRGLQRTLGIHPEARFGHNDYLGLRRDPRLLAALSSDLAEGLPLTSSGSRLLSGNLGWFRAFEQEFARAARFPDALLFASASEANRAVVCALAGRQDVVVHDALAHASLIDGILHSGATRRKFAHNDPEDLRAQLQSAGGKIRLVVTESVFSMDGDLAPLADLHQVCKEEGALLLVDEAHAVGLFGPARTGLGEGLPKDSTLVATTHGFGKALASAGGILCTHPAVIQSIVNTSRAFIFTTAPSPLAVSVAQHTWKLSQTDRERHDHLFQLCKHLERGLRDAGWALPSRSTPTPIFPLLCGGLEQAVQKSESLKRRGIFLRPIRPPTVPAGSERLRATVTADLHTSDLEEFLGALHAL
jgi:8-amino-7-oxononanoate synthase